MLAKIIQFSVRHKLLILVFTFAIITFGIYALSKIPIGAVPDVTNNQVQVITTSGNLSTQDIEQFVTYPIELEMANLPGVEEIRSVSKFGLSVVTIVFDDAMGTYIPRQLIAEKLIAASESIPKGFGTPQMGPITTGLGEIYQYILDVKPGYEDLYDATELRSIQDWVIKRQLSGIPGVVEINTWGGYLKQYEVALDPSRLQAMEISLTQVIEALENNNSVAGGAYIEKNAAAYFVRGEGKLVSKDEIGAITVAVKDGRPVLIRDLATINIGHANRFGAITGNGEGEKVLGQVMMLKGANSKKVIEDVRQRVDEINKTLPEGVFINGFLDRSELIGRTTFTVYENLVLGCLIVIFVVVILLGNLRSGLVIASVIPLSLMFALSMMYLFGVDANLMSLGAIDFGIIIDGAVIIVEFIAFKIFNASTQLQQLSKEDREEQLNAVVVSGTSQLMSSAIFGQLIILIVFIPILSLSGVEGKMFRPMALTFSFALIGAVILCLTYVPVISALLLKPGKLAMNRHTKRMMEFLEAHYESVLRKAFAHGKWVITVALGLLMLAGIMFWRMGGEFIPTLDEGDFVIQPVLPTGTSLTETINVTTRIETVLKEQFPEVRQVVSRIGAAEVPTDPMSMEESDVIITLAPKDKWVTAETKDQLAEAFKKALDKEIPQMEVEFTQPIEMRFNELITGVRADIAVKIFGEDLGTLARLGSEIGNIARDIPGAADVAVEKIEGLPQMLVAYDRGKLSRYGVDIAYLNRMLAMAFAGEATGSIFEGERRYDLVVRLAEDRRQGLQDLGGLYIDLPDGGKVPLSELAEIRLTEGAAKISRDNTRRRIVVGINVRERDLESVVKDLQNRIAAEVKLPAGYNIDYGGQFENLESAKSRLMIAVPLAMALIFIMLYFAFGTFREALLIFTAIPLASVGGVFFLGLRGMPFSISAGVGFIALFGISVLNGIVLIEHIKAMKESDFSSHKELIIQAAKERLRAVMLTAMSAALGFLPMAISANAGAEVQRPLATVVIGGLFTAALLTLVVLPILYHRVTNIRVSAGSRPDGVALSVIMVLGLFLGAGTQDASAQQLSLDRLIDTAMVRNKSLLAESKLLEASRSREGSAWDLGKTDFYYHYDENNLAINNLPLHVFGLTQNFDFPGRYVKRGAVFREQSRMIQQEMEWKKQILISDITQAYYHWVYLRSQLELIGRLDSLYSVFSRSAGRRFELGDTNYLEKVTARARFRQVSVRLNAARLEVDRAVQGLKLLVQSETDFEPLPIPFQKLPVLEADPENHPKTALYRSRELVFQQQTDLLKMAYYPDFSLNYFSGSNASLSGRLQGIQVGLQLPLIFGSKRAEVKRADFEQQATVMETAQVKTELHVLRDRLQLELAQGQEQLNYFEEEGLMLSDEILKAAESGYQHGEIDFFEYILSVENAYEIRLEYLKALEQYNATVISLNHLIPNK